MYNVGICSLTWNCLRTSWITNTSLLSFSMHGDLFSLPPTHPPSLQQKEEEHHLLQKLRERTAHRLCNQQWLLFVCMYVCLCMYMLCCAVSLCLYSIWQSVSTSCDCVNVMWLCLHVMWPHVHVMWLCVSMRASLRERDKMTFCECTWKKGVYRAMYIFLSVRKYMQLYIQYLAIWGAPVIRGQMKTPRVAWN